MNILFTPPADDKVLDGTKTMTARCWRQNPPVVGQHVNAQTGRSNATQFALLKVIDVFKWSGLWSDEHVTHDVAKKEGFKDIAEFMNAYEDLNGKRRFDKTRTHYFIEFEVVHNLRER